MADTSRTSNQGLTLVHFVVVRPWRVELYCLLAFLYPQTFTTAAPFETAFDLTKNTVGPWALKTI